MSNIIKRILEGVEPGTTPTSQDCAHEVKVMREGLNEEQIDKTLRDSFPASDPPSWY